jgi:iron(III) transport system ATP-binding protein
LAELRCEALAKSYAEHMVLRDVDLVVPGGTLTAILGASGSGKTTLLRIVMGLLAPDAGRVLVGGTLLSDAGEARSTGRFRRARRNRVDVAPDKRSIGYVAQEAALFPHLSAGENIVFGLPWSERRRGARLAQMLELVGLHAGYRDRRPHELSGGEQRRVALARALAPQPRLVLLDEPFSGLDAALRVETREAVMRALAQEQATALLVTHDQAEALSMGREVAVLREGALVQRAVPARLYREPVDLQTARFVGDAVILPGDAAGGRVLCALGELELGGSAAGWVGPVQVMVRPEQIRVARRDPALGPGADQTARPVPASVVGHACYGADTVLTLALADAPETVVKARTLERELPAPGERVDLAVHGAVIAYPAGQATISPAAEMAASAPS